LSTEVKEFGTDFVAPTDTNYTKYVDYTMTSQGGKSNGQFKVNFLNFSDNTGTANTRVESPMPSAMLAKYQDLDWANASVSFYVYFADMSDKISGLELCGTQASTGVDYSQTNTENCGSRLTTLTAGKWTKVTFKLSDVCPDATQLDVASGNYNIKVWLAFVDSAYTSSASPEDHAAKTWSFYMTGFEFIA